MSSRSKKSSNEFKNKKDLIKSIISRVPRKKFLSDSQEEYYNRLIENEITICSGPAGVGKSYMAMKAAIDLLIDDDNPLWYNILSSSMIASWYVPKYFKRCSRKISNHFLAVLLSIG